MDDKEREAADQADRTWLANLQLKAEVLVECGRSETRYSLGKVERITKTLIILEGGDRFKRNGHAQGQWNHGYLLNPTEKRLDTWRRQNLGRNLMQFGWSDLSLGKMRAVRQLLDGTPKCSSFTPEQKKIVEDWVESKVFILLQEIDRSEKGLLEIDKRPREMYTPEKPDVFFRYARQAMLEDLVSALTNEV